VGFGLLGLRRDADPEIGPSRAQTTDAAGARLPRGMQVISLGAIPGSSQGPSSPVPPCEIAG
jgi:hypothetical protein